MNHVTPVIIFVGILTKIHGHQHLSRTLLRCEQSTVKLQLLYVFSGDAIRLPVDIPTTGCGMNRKRRAQRRKFR